MKMNERNTEVYYGCEDQEMRAPRPPPPGGVGRGIIYLRWGTHPAQRREGIRRRGGDLLSGSSEDFRDFLFA